MMTPPYEQLLQAARVGNWYFPLVLVEGKDVRDI